MDDLAFIVVMEHGSWFLEAFRGGELVVMGTAVLVGVKWVYQWNAHCEGAQDRKQVLAVRSELRRRLKLAVA